MKPQIINKTQIIADVILMRGSNIEGNKIYYVNEDGSVNPWSNNMENIQEALNHDYDFYEIRIGDKKYLLTPHT